jgi:hypothetical protein
MCRPSCCKPHSQTPGVAAVALIIGAGIAVDKIRPEMARIVHIATEVLRILALTTMTIVAVTIAAWASTWLLRWWLRRCEAQSGHLRQGSSTGTSHLRPPQGKQSCLACGGKGEVLRANDNGSFEPRACPECQPARLAG